jgi:hypothetical protein
MTRRQHAADRRDDKSGDGMLLGDVAHAELELIHQLFLGSLGFA